jgi:BMFP domain-containing protein YqiC
MDEETRYANTPMQEAEGDVEMTLRDIGTKDLDIKDIVEREGIDLPNILEKWKR